MTQLLKHASQRNRPGTGHPRRAAQRRKLAGFNPGERPRIHSPDETGQDRGTEGPEEHSVHAAAEADESRGSSCKERKHRRGAELRAAGTSPVSVDAAVESTAAGRRATERSSPARKPRYSPSGDGRHQASMLPKFPRKPTRSLPLSGPGIGKEKRFWEIIPFAEGWRHWTGLNSSGSGTNREVINPFQKFIGQHWRSSFLGYQACD